MTFHDICTVLQVGGVEDEREDGGRESKRCDEVGRQWEVGGASPVRVSSWPGPG